MTQQYGTRPQRPNNGGDLEPAARTAKRAQGLGPNLDSPSIPAWQDPSNTTPLRRKRLWPNNPATDLPQSVR